jgi:hypothetical protein
MTKAWAVTVLLVGALGCAQTAGAQKSAAPSEDFSGTYSFLAEGEFVQINIEDGNRLTGFISRYGEGEKGSFVDHFFDKAELRDHNIRFTTRKVHGIWFDFKGAVSRGPGKTREAEAYYVIKGTLTQYTSDANQVVTAKAREAEFRSFPLDIEDDTKPGGARH